jgi:peptidoglycan/LPS O-acetylase OafA/YrhL
MLLDDHKHRSVIDFMRAAGILLVICFHVIIGLTTLVDADQMPGYIDEVPRAFNIMWQAMGSEIIFLFSGFLLSYLLMREYVRTSHIDVRDFYLRRLSRIVPLYLVAILLYALVRDFTAGELFLNVLFVSQIFGATTIVPVGWSLEVLMQSYVLLPFLVLLLLRSGHPLKLCAVAIAGFLALRYSAFALDPISYLTPIHELFVDTDTTATQDAAYYLLHFRATPFLLGFFFAHLVIYRDAALQTLFSRRGIAPLVLIISLATVVLSGFLPVHDPDSFIYAIAADRFWLYFWTFQRFVFSIGICGMALTAWYGSSPLVEFLCRATRWPVWKTVSSNIYSIYLFHPVFLIPGAVIGFRTVSREAIFPIHILEIVATIILVAMFATLFGSMTTRYLELPAQRWIRKRFGHSN